MVDIQRIVVQWSGLSGLPGVSVMYGVAGGTANADIKALFTSVATVLVSPLQLQIPGSGDLIDVATGALTGAWTNPAGAGTITSGASNNYAAGVGAYVVWNTSLIVGRRRLKGRTFLCPLNSGDYDTSGSIAATPLGTLQTAANTLVGTTQLRVWHRPGAVAGIAVSPISATVPDQVTSLRSRRR